MASDIKAANDAYAVIDLVKKKIGQFNNLKKLLSIRFVDNSYSLVYILISWYFNRKLDFSHPRDPKTAPELQEFRE